MPGIGSLISEIDVKIEKQAYSFSSNARTLSVKKRSLTFPFLEPTDMTDETTLFFHKMSVIIKINRCC